MTKSKEMDSKKHHVERQLEEEIEQVFPTKLTRRDTLMLFSGFDKNANRKIMGAIYQFFKK